MRIVAGTARGRRLVGPEGDRTRPTADRVKEAMFNALFSLGVIDDAVMVDLFAGSGALGLEALSRGAAHVTFVERDRSALSAIRDNIEALGFGDRSRVVAADALGWIHGPPPIDVVLADPPYGFDGWTELLDAARLADVGLLVAESGATLGEVPGWECVRERSYGTTVVTILRPVGVAEATPQETP